MKNKKKTNRGNINKRMTPMIAAGIIISIIYFIIIVFIVFIDIVSWLKVLLIVMDTVLVGIMIQTMVDRILELTNESEKRINSK